ncbi:MAG: sodium-dependent transporter [Gemmatimonadota bacterium]
MSGPASGRPKFTTGFGVLMALIGVAVGLGNVWRFPYMAAAFGGGAFLLLYLVILGAFGIPALLAELTLGRLTRRGPVGAFTSIGMPAGKLAGWALFITIAMAASYYTVIVGWVLRYFFISLSGRIARIDASSFFDNLLGGFLGQFLMTAIVLGLVAVVLMMGIRKGVERISTVGMPLLFILLILLIGRSVTLPGAGEGLRYYLLPDFSKLDFSVASAALGQVFFSIGLGGTFMLTYASYLPDSTNLKMTGLSVGIGETLAAILAGFVIIPAAFALGLELNSGPSLTFITVPSIFAQIPAGALFATLFFGLLFFAAFLSDVAAIEVLVAGVVDELGWERNKSIMMFCGAVLLLGIVPMLSLDYILKSDLFWGSTMQPVGSVIALLGLAWVVGLGKALEEVNRGNAGRPVGRLWFYWIKYVVPLGIGLILALGLRDLFTTLVL